MSKIVLYGIANCDTIKKAKTWMQDRGIEFVFHDYRKDGLEPSLLQDLVGRLGWESMLNRRGTTWRKLPDAIKNHIDKASAMEAMRENPALITRPILASDDELYLGFSAQQYEEIFS